MSTVDKIIKLQASQNIADALDNEQLALIGDRVVQETKIDLDSMSTWLVNNKKGMEIAMQVVEKKSSPWAGAANVYYPLIANGAITFASREYPQIVRGEKVVEAAVFGKDDDAGNKAKRASRISKYMSWQLLIESDEWEADTDKLLVMLGTVGTVFRKSYHNPILQRNISEVCRPDQIIVNNNIKSLDTARRITHKIYLYSNDIIERMRLGLYCDYDIKDLEPGKIQDDESPNDSDRPHEILEQHRYLDLDEDGYAEPYIVTVHASSQKVLRIVARFDIDGIKFTDDEKKIQYIRPVHYFTDYHFLPSPDGSFFSMGFGSFLYPLNNSINTVINQLLDAGTLANMQAGFIGAGVRLKSGEFKVSPGKWHKVEGMGGYSLKDNIVPLPANDPSNVLFQLLGLLIEAGKELASVTDILQGKQPTQNSPATSVLALIKQGLVQYNAIHKRVLRSFKKEFGKLYYLNSKYLNVMQYIQMSDDPEASENDFNLDDLDIRPVADPNVASDVQRIAKAESIMQIPGLNPLEQRKQYLEAIEADNIAVLLQDPGPSPEAQKMMAEVETEKAKAQDMMLQHTSKAVEFELRQKELEAKLEAQAAELAKKLEEMDANINYLKAQTVKAMAEAHKAKREADAPRPTGTNN